MSTANILAELSSSEISNACESMIPSVPLRLCYVRDAAYAELDPLLAALRLMTGAQMIRGDLPRAMTELAGVDALVVTARQPANPAAAKQEIERIGALAAQTGVKALYLGEALSQHAKSLPKNVIVRPLPLTLSELGTFLREASNGSTARAA
jgi:hypothetical protein